MDYCECELQIHNGHSVNTSFIIVTEEVRTWSLRLRRGRVLTREGAPPLLPIERPADLQERRGPRRQATPENEAPAGGEGGGPGSGSSWRRVSHKKKGEQGSLRSRDCAARSGHRLRDPPTGLQTQLRPERPPLA